MADLIILGELPGTDSVITFTGFLLALCVVGAIYVAARQRSDKDDQSATGNTL